MALRADRRSTAAPRSTRRRCTVTGATVSARTARTVTLQVDGLKPDRVVHLRSPRPFASATDETLWSTEAWYTLNSYPGYVATDPEPAPDGIYELEDGELAGSAGIDTEHAGYTGSGFVAGIQTVGSGTTVEVVAPKAGTYRPADPLRQRPEPAPNQTKKMSLYIGDERQQITAAAVRRLEDVGHVHRPGHAAGRRHPRRDRLRAGRRRQRQPRPRQGRRPDRRSHRGRGRHPHRSAQPRQTEHAGYSGTGYVGGFENDGTAVTFDVTATDGRLPRRQARLRQRPNPQPNQTKR